MRTTRRKGTDGATANKSTTYSRAMPLLEKKPQVAQVEYVLQAAGSKQCVETRILQESGFLSARLEPPLRRVPEHQRQVDV